jgi:hypothetical protein
MSALRRVVVWSSLMVATVGFLTACSGGSSPSSNPSAAGTSSGATAVESNPGGDIPDSQAFVPFRDPAGRFTVTVPEGWTQTSVATATLFTDKYNSIRIESRAAASAPTIDSARATDLPAVQASSQGFAAGTASTVNRNAGQVILLTYHANSVPNAVTGKVAAEAVERYAFWRNGREVILTLSAPIGSDNVDPWRKVTDSFTWSNG